jgi:hypothetical protein
MKFLWQQSVRQVGASNTYKHYIFSDFQCSLRKDGMVSYAATARRPDHTAVQNMEPKTAIFVGRPAQINQAAALGST